MEKLPTSSKALRYLPFLVASAFFMQMLDATILNTAIPTIARSFNSHPLQLHSLVTAYMPIVLAIFAGRAYERSYYILVLAGIAGVIPQMQFYLFEA